MTVIYALAAIGAVTLATVLFIGVRQFCRDWGNGYPWMGIRR